jgi:hypothetical protein
MAVPTTPQVPSGAIAPIDGQKATYSAAIIGLVPGSAATDIATLTGSASKVVKLVKVEITATTTSATPAALDVLLLKRSTANTAGTSTGSPTPVAHDSANPTVSATFLAYTAPPTPGTLVGTALKNDKLMMSLATATATDFPGVQKLTWIWDQAEQSPTLRGTGDVVAVNLNGATPTATASFDIAFVWTEE